MNKRTVMNRELRELIIMLTDAYKLFHRQMYPKNTVLVYSNGTARSSRHYKGDNKNEVVVFGTQRLSRLLKDKFQDFFDLPEEEVISFCKEQLSSFTGMDYDVNHIVELHRLQYLPLVLKSLPEGSKCPIGVPYMTFYNTSNIFWLTNYLETFISCEVWSLITNATIANEYREIFDKWALKTVGNTDFVPFQGHDFSMRGMMLSDAARASGLAHLTSFCGSDTIPSYLDAQYYYDSGQNDWSKFPKGIVATSVPASEHSVQCAHYNPADGDELTYLDYLLDEFEDAPVLSIVCDGFDYWKFITEVVPMRKDKIMARSGKVVFRPDSGHIVDIICGTKDINNQGLLTGIQPKTTQQTINEERGSIQLLYDIFGGTINEKGFKELDPHVGLIYGDSVTLQIADEVCSKLATKGFASTNWVAGIGSYTYQFNTRDSHGQAIKATFVEFQKLTGRSGKEIFKDPKTGDGTKKSAKGLLSVIDEGNGKLTLCNEVSWVEEEKGMLKEILRDGELLNQTTIQEIRNRLNH